jgi:hypothetical protein
MPTVFVETLASLLPAQPAPAGRMLSETLFTLLPVSLRARCLAAR